MVSNGLFLMDRSLVENVRPGCRTAVDSPLRQFKTRIRVQRSQRRALARTSCRRAACNSERFCIRYAFSLSFRYVALNNNLSFRHRSSLGATFWNFGLGG